MQVAQATHARDNPPAGPNRNTLDYAAVVAAHNPLTLREATILRTSMIEEAANKEQRQAIADAWAPVIERLSLVE